MTEIQIVGPIGSEAPRFTKFFDDDIVIEPNSKIHLNHATLSKNESVTFTEPQTFGLVITQADVYGNFTDNLTLSFTIPEGNKTYKELEALLISGIQGIIDANPTVFTAYVSIKNNDDFLGIRPVGTFYELNNAVGTLAPINLNFTVAAAPEKRINQTGADNAAIQSFFMMPYPYFHATTIPGDLTDASVGKINGVAISLLDGANALTIDDILNKATPPIISFGFYGKEYALDNTVGTGTRTNAAALNLVGGLPTMFFQAVVDVQTLGGGDKVILSIYCARSTAQGIISDWDKQQYEINANNLLTTIDLTESGFFGDFDPLAFKIFTYQKEKAYAFPTQFETYFAIASYTPTGLKLVTTTELSSVGVKLPFFTGLGTGSDLIKRSQRPFYPCFSTNIQGYGAEMLIPTPLTNDASVIVRQLKYEVSPRLGKVMGINTTGNLNANSLYETQTFYPNSFSPTIFNALPNTFEDFYRMDSYVIKVNNIPIQSYKTNQTKGNRGYKQSILGVIPTPFQSVNKETRVNIDGQDYLASTYEPHYPLYKNMKNQKIVVNSFDIEVTRLSDDTEAKDLDQVSFNFTITSPE